MSGLVQYHKREKLSGLDPTKPLFGDLYLPNATSDSSKDVSHQLLQMLAKSETVGQVGSALRGDKRPSPTVAEGLFEASAEIKVATSRVAMHLDDAWRKQLFSKIDRLLNVENWHDEDIILKPTSFQTYLRFFLHTRPRVQPNLGISDAGNLLAGWIKDQNRLSIEFFPGDATRWVLVRYVDDERESAAADVPLSRLAEVLAPYDPETWWENGSSAIRYR